MRRMLTGVAVIAVLGASMAAFGMYDVAESGTWPAEWPKELEPWRKTSRTLVGPMIENCHYEIPFTKQDEFEAAWPYILKVKTKGAPIILVRGPKVDFFQVKPAGVLIHTPPVGPNARAAPQEPLPASVTKVRERWMNTTFIELAVDGNIVDLNRIPLPPDTPIIDERFKTEEPVPVRKHAATPDAQQLPPASTR